MLGLALSFLCSSAPAGQAEASWFPFSARTTLTGFLTPEGPPVVGADLDALVTLGHPQPGGDETWSGLTFGVGLRGFFGASPWTFCDLCLARQTFGPAARVSYVRSSHMTRWAVPGLSVWLQASPLLVRETLPQAPLTQGGTRLAGGVRLDLGLTFVGWTRGVFKLIGSIVSESNNEVGLVTLLPLFIVGFINHLALTWEYTGTAVSMSAHRFGASIGASF